MFTKIISYTLRLTILCVVTAFFLSLVYGKTKPMIEEQIKTIDNRARKEVLPLADRFEQISENYFMAYDKNGSKVGKIVKSSQRGYGGQIKIMVGVDNEEKIVGIKILEHYETPGLGDEITKKKFTLQFNHRTVSELRLKKDNGSIDAITGATISSKACVAAVRSGLEYLKQYEPGK
ncbi:MAG: RnfABCDGE type electron transport complex subunit G [Candidatus Omnitrophota bacterium]